MKVIHLISGGDVGGAKTHVLSLLASLGRERAALVCFKDGEFADDARALGIDTRICAGGIKTCIAEITKMIREEKVDIVHCHGSRANFIGSLVKGKAKVPFVTTVHSDPKLDYMGRFAARMTYGVLNAHALRKMDYYIGVSDSMAELLSDRGFPPEKIFTIYNGIDFSVETHPKSREEFFASYGIKAEKSWVIAGIGARLNPVKDMKTLIRAAAKASESCDDLHVAIAGDGEELEMLTSLAKELGIADKVHFLGWVDDMFSFYNSIDINTLTSLSETFPYALTEGTRFALPAVSSRVGGVAKLILDGRCGYLFDSGDWETMADRLKILCQNPEKRAEMGKALQQRAMEYFSLEKTCETQLEIYESILKRTEQLRSGGRCGVTVCGAYGQKNSGDDAILESIVRSLRTYDRDLPVRIMTRTPKTAAKAYRANAVFTFNPFAYRKAMKKSKLFLCGGGSLIQNVTSRRSLWFYLHAIKTAKKLGCKVMMYGCGIGPVNGEKDRKKASAVLDSCVDTITLREDSSLKELENLGITKPKTVLAADPALSLRFGEDTDGDAIMRKCGLDPDIPGIGFALRRWDGFDKKAQDIALAADYAYEKYGLTPVFVSINGATDNQAAQDVLSKMKAPGKVVTAPASSAEIAALLSKMRAVVSMRLHGLIFASAGAVPLVGISYDPKVSAFLRYIGQSDVIELSELDFEKLRSAIDLALSSDTSQQSELVEKLVSLEKKNMECAAELL